MRSSTLHLLLSGLLILISAPVLAGGGYTDGLNLPEDATYIGSESCLDCHDDIGEASSHTAHSVELDPMVPGLGAASCEACHGPGSIHAEDEDVDAIINVDMIRAMNDRQRSDMCLQCHGDNHPDWVGGPHQGTGVSCADCHSDQMHFQGETLSVANFRNESEFCLQCHTTEVADFRLPFRHRVLEGQIMCSDCHDPHKGFSDDGWNGLNDTCLGCHTEMAGPFVFEHDGVQSEDCTMCHKAHGSTHDKMLVTDGNTLCMQCHYETTFNADDNWGVADVNHGGMLTSEGRCYDCHTEIHGSNVAPSFRDQ